jgi:hypothetical protein
MVVEVFRFGDSAGGHAAFLWLRPARAIESPLARSVATHANVRRGVTIAGWRNYVFRFRGAAPDTRDFERLLNSLPEVDPRDPCPDKDGEYLDRLSQRGLLGPISLARFARRIPPSVAAFHLGVRGCSARFETPAGSMLRIVFEYPSAAAARGREAAFRALPGALVRVTGRKIGLIFDPADAQQAEALLRDITDDESSEPMAVGWVNMCDGGTGGSSMIGMVLTGYLLGGPFALLRCLLQWRDGIPDRTISLHLRRG